MREMQLFWSNDREWQCLYEVEKSKNESNFQASSSLLGMQDSKVKNDLYANFSAKIVRGWPELFGDFFWWQQTWHFLIKYSTYMSASTVVFYGIKNSPAKHDGCYKSKI